MRHELQLAAVVLQEQVVPLVAGRGLGDVDADLKQPAQALGGGCVNDLGC